MKQVITDASLRGGGLYAVVLQDGGVVYEETGQLPGRRPDSSMYAEGRAVFVGLNRARAHDWTDFVAITDNKVVVEQVRRARNKFWHALRSLLEQMGGVLRWRPREYVAAADALIREQRMLWDLVRAVFPDRPEPRELPA